MQEIQFNDCYSYLSAVFHANYSGKWSNVKNFNEIRYNPDKSKVLLFVHMTINILRLYLECSQCKLTNKLFYKANQESTSVILKKISKLMAKFVDFILICCLSVINFYCCCCILPVMSYQYVQCEFDYMHWKVYSSFWILNSFLSQSSASQCKTVL